MPAPYFQRVVPGPANDRRKAWIEEYLAAVNNYLARTPELEISTEACGRIAASMDKLILTWTPDDKADFRRTGEFLLEFANRHASSTDANRRSLVHSSLFLRQIARTTGGIPNGITTISPTAKGTVAKLELLARLIKYEADEPWVNQEQGRLEGLLDEAPYQSIRLIVKRQQSLEHWMNVLSSGERFHALSTPNAVSFGPPIDPVLLAVILQSFVGTNQGMDDVISQPFAQSRSGGLFASNIRDIVNGKTVHRGTILRCFANTHRAAISQNLKDEITKLVPDITAFIDFQANDLREQMADRELPLPVSNWPVIPRDAESIFENLVKCRDIRVSSGRVHHRFSINKNVNLSRLSKSLESLANQKRDVVAFECSNRRRGDASLFLEQLGWHKEIGPLRLLMRESADSVMVSDVAQKVLDSIVAATESPSQLPEQLVEPEDYQVFGYELYRSTDLFKRDDYTSVLIGPWNSQRTQLTVSGECDRNRLAELIQLLTLEGKQAVFLKSPKEKGIHLCTTSADAPTFVRAILEATSRRSEPIEDSGKSEASD